MHIVHGTWIPDAPDFVQGGAFYLWVETDTSHQASKDIHPRHLMRTALVAFLVEKLGMREAALSILEPKYFLLPTVDLMPAPSFELLRYVEEEEPLEFVLQPWQVYCYPVSDVIATLNDIHFIALNAAEDFQLGADLLFWHQYTQALKGIIAKDQYIPALKYQEFLPPPMQGQGKVRVSRHRVFPVLSYTLHGSCCPIRMRR